ncbi:MAG: single-stranded DNA-binding protein [Cyanobacteria bacterium P01_A01_bin.135]
MNNCILMAEVVQAPQLRYTSDTQTPIAEMSVQFEALRDGDPPETVKVVGWGNLAQEIQERYHVGDRVIVEGRLGMISTERPEGFREKRAELTAQRIHLLGGGESIVSSAESQPTAKRSPAPAPAPPPSDEPPMPAEADLDDIPF